MVRRRCVLSALREKRSPSAGVVYISGAGILGRYLTCLSFCSCCVVSSSFWIRCVFSLFLIGTLQFDIFLLTTT